jgi:hypothetical protein
VRQKFVGVLTINGLYMVFLNRFIVYASIENNCYYHKSKHAGIYYTTDKLEQLVVEKEIDELNPLC